MWKIRLLDQIGPPPLLGVDECGPLPKRIVLETERERELLGLVS